MMRLIPAVFALLVFAAPAALAQTPEPVLPHNLSAWGMFMGADWVVKTVMIGLAIASVVTWTVFFAKHLEVAKAVKAIRASLAELGQARALSDVNPVSVDPLTTSLIGAARAELTQSAGALSDASALKDRIGVRLERIEAAAARRIADGAGILATIGATAPFVGLFGTVWGIMNSFIGIAATRTTNLAVVAPGIAEALLATALGLLAAIPAVVIYNHFSRRIAGYRALAADASAAVLVIASRDLSRGVAGKGD